MDRKEKTHTESALHPVYKKMIAGGTPSRIAQSRLMPLLIRSSFGRVSFPASLAWKSAGLKNFLA